MLLDDWQAGVLEASLGEDRDGLWAASRVGVSVPRQNGKGALIEARELAGLLLFGEELIIASSHEYKTAVDGFRRIRGYFENYDDLRKKVKRLSTSTAREFIELRSGQMLRFMARSKSSGRGFSADCLILDEAQELGDDEWAAMLPTISARPNPQTWLLGTPPSPKMDGTVFSRFRAAGLQGEDTRLAWCEWAAEAGADLDDQKAWEQANPGLGIRIPLEAIADERFSMDDETFARERLGMWESSSSLHVIDPDTWAACEQTTSIPTSRFVLAVDVNPERSTAAIAFAGARADGLAHVELDEQRAGTGWVAAYLEDRCTRNPIAAVVVDAKSPAASLVDELRRRRLPVIVTGYDEMATACGGFYDAVMEGTVRHTGQPQLTTALSVARKRALGDRWAWNRKNAASDITPLVASTLALWGVMAIKVKDQAPARAPRRIY